MKKIALAGITGYQIVISPLLKGLLGVSRMCVSTPSCSEYAKQSIQKYGIIKGGYISVIRILHCQPDSKNPKYKFGALNLKF